MTDRVAEIDKVAESSLALIDGDDVGFDGDRSYNNGE